MKRMRLFAPLLLILLLAGSFSPAGPTLGAAAQSPSAGPPWYARGDFNSWGTTPMYDDGSHGDVTSGDNIYTVVITATSAGFYQWKADDGTWADPHPPVENSWFETTIPSQTVTLLFDTNTYADGWMPNGNIVNALDGWTSWTAVGNWQGWDNANPQTTMVDSGGGLYVLTTRVATAATYEYKVVRTGSWASVVPQIGGTEGGRVFDNFDSLAFTTTENNQLVRFLFNVNTGRIQVQFPTSSVLINETDADTAGTEVEEFIELYDGGVGNTALDGLVVVLFNGSDDQSYTPAFDLDGYSTDANGYFVIGGTGVPGADIVVSSSYWLQNGADAVALFAGDAVEFPNDTPVTTTNLIDAIVYDTNDSDDPGLLPLLNAGQPQVDEGTYPTSEGQSNQRCPDGAGGARNTDTYIQDLPTPDGPNACLPDLVLDKSGPALAMPGALVDYTLIYSNSSRYTASAVILEDWLLPGELGYVTDDSGLPCPACIPGASGILTWSVGLLNPGEIYSFTLTAMVSTNVPLGTVVTNTAFIHTPDAEMTTTNNLAHWLTTISALDLVVAKTGPAYGMPGGDLVYTIELQAQGANANNVILTDTLPLSLTYTADDSGVMPANPSPGVYVWSLGTVPSGTMSFHLTATVSAAITQETVLTNTATASTDTAGDDPINNTAEWPTTFYPLVSIYDLQYVPDPASDDASPYAGQVVWTEGVVVAGTDEIGPANRYFFIADPAGGPWSGMFVYNYGVFADVVEGDYVRLLGEVEEYFGMTEFNIRYAPHELQVLGSGSPLPAPEVISTGAYTTSSPNTAEPYESVLIEFQNATVTRAADTFGEWHFDDGSGVARANDYGAGDGDLSYTPTLGDQYVFIRGIGWYAYSDYKLEPRYDPDILLLQPPELTLVYHDLEDVVGAGEAVYVAGDFNAWDPLATPLAPNGDASVFSVTLSSIASGTYNYKYVVYTDTTPSGPANWNWLQSGDHVVTVSGPTWQEDYRYVEFGYLVLQWPPSTTTTMGEPTENVYGQIWADDLTSRAGPPRAVWAELGFGSDADPANWTDWFAMDWGSQQGDNDEFYGVMTPTVPGVYSYVVRFDANWGIGNPHTAWAYGDLDGVYPGEPFEIENAGVLTVEGAILINEVDADTPSYDTEEFIEIYDGGVGNMPLDGLVVVLYNGGTDTSYVPAGFSEGFDLDGYTTDANGYFVIGSVPEADLYVDPGSSGWLQNGADAVALYSGDGSDFPSGTPVTNTNLLDAIVYDTNDGDDPGLLDVLLNPGQPQVNEDGAGDKDFHSNQRCPNGAGGGRNTDTYLQDVPTPDGPNACLPDLVLDKSGPALAMPGELVDYTLAYSNTGRDSASAVVLEDLLLPGELIYVADDSGLPCPACIPGASGILTWSVGMLDPGEVYTFTLTAMVSTNVPFGTVVTNTAFIHTPDAEVTTTNNLALWPSAISALDLVANKYGPDYGISGHSLSYFVLLQNLGVATATNVIVTDTLPLSTTYVSDDSGVTPSNPEPGVYVWSFGDVPSDTIWGFNITVTVDVSVTGGTVLTNWIEASTDTPGDAPGNNQDSHPVTVYPLVPIHDIQYVPDPANDDVSPYEGQIVWTEGVVVAGTGEIGTPGNNLVIAEPAGGPWSGLMVYNGGAFADVVEGDHVRLLGLVAEYYGMTEFDISEEPHALELLAIGQPLPAPEILTTGAYTTSDPASAEPYESVLIQFENAVVTDEDIGNGEWLFDDGSGNTAADDYGEIDGDLTYLPSDGDFYAYIRGIGWYSYSDYKLMPRYDPDISLAYPLYLTYHDLEDAVGVGEAVYVAGDFNGWDPLANPLTPNGDASAFDTVLTLGMTGTYAYKYIVYTDTAPSGPAHWDWLNTNDRTVTVEGATAVDDYRAVDVGYAHLVEPAAITITLGDSTGPITGEVYIQNVTNPEGEGRAVAAELGYGSDPDPANWDWMPLSFSGAQNGNNDLYHASFTPTMAGVYSYAVRFDGNWAAGNPNAGWTYGDLDGVYPGEPFELENAGVLAVFAPIEPNLGNSDKVADRPVLQPGELFSYTIYLSNTGLADAYVLITDVLPAEVTVVTATLPAGMAYDEVLHELYWAGDVLMGQQVELLFQAVANPDLVDGQVFTNTVWIDDGVHAPFQRDEAVEVVIPCQAPSNAAFDWTPTLPAVGETVTLTASAEGSAPLAFDWDLGDGSFAGGDLVTHVYTASGDYTVYLLVSNECGWEGISHTITVVSEPCEAVEIVTVTYEVDGCQATFYPTLSGDEPITWLWDLGALGTSTETNPLVDFGQTGTYTVTLEAWNCGGNGYDSHTFSLYVECAVQYKVFLPLVLNSYGF